MRHLMMKILVSCVQNDKPDHDDNLDNFTDAQVVYPEIASGTEDPDSQNRAGDWSTCKGCRGNMARTRREHTHVSEVSACIQTS